MSQSVASPTLEDAREFWPEPNVCDGFEVSELLDEVRCFALVTFDSLDLDGNGFISKKELELALASNHLKQREKNYVRFLLRNIHTISRAHDDNDGINPCGISRKDLLGISRPDVTSYFERM